jgi:hypothetical protein
MALGIFFLGEGQIYVYMCVFLQSLSFETNIDLKG